MYLKLIFVGFILVLLSFAVKAESQPDTNAIENQANKAVDQMKPELGDYTVKFLKSMEGGIGYVFAGVASFSGNLLGVSKGSMLILILGLALIFGTILFMKTATNWGTKFLIVLILLGVLLAVIGSIPLFFKYGLPAIQGFLK